MSVLKSQPAPKHHILLSQSRTYLSSRPIPSCANTIPLHYTVFIKSSVSPFCDAIRCLLKPSSLSSRPNVIPSKHIKCIRKFINCLLQDLTFCHKCTTLNIFKILMFFTFFINPSAHTITVNNTTCYCNLTFLLLVFITSVR